MGNILIEIILRFGNSFVKMKPNCRDYGLNKRSHLFFYSFWSLRLKEYHSSGRTSRRSVPNFWECRIKMFWIPHVPRSTQSCCFVFTGPGENPLFQLSFRSKPDTGAVLHQRNNKNLTACSLYNECNNLQRTDPFCFPPSFRCNTFVCQRSHWCVWAKLARPVCGRVTLAPGASKTERRTVRTT